MRRLAALLVVVGVVAAASFFAARRPVTVELNVDFGQAPPHEATLVFTRQDEHVERELKLLSPPTRDHRTIRLPRGQFTVGARLQYQGQPERTLSRPLSIEQAGTYTLDLN